jgi:hypothetical protein
MSEINARNIDTENSEYAKTYLTDNEDKYLLDNVGVYLITDYKKEDDIMANTTKKYVSLDKLTKYDQLLKAKVAADDAAILQSAKDYADSLEGNYEAAGAVASAKTELQGNIDALANGAVAANTAAIAKLNGDASTVGSVAKAVSDSAATLQASIDAVSGVANQNAADIETLEGQVDALIKGTYDDTEVREMIADNTEAIGTLGQNHATDKKALEDAIALKAAQSDLDAVSAVANAAATQTALQGEIDRAKGEESRIEGLVTAEAQRAAGVEAGLEDRIETMEAFWTAAQADGTDSNVIDTLKEIQDYISGDESGAAEMLASIQANAKAIEDMDAAYKAADVTLQGNIDKKADTSDLEALDGRVEELEAASETHALKTEVTAVSDELTAYKDAHAGDYSNSQIDAAIKVNTDAIAKLNDTYATDAELATAIEGEVSRANGAYAAKALETTVSNHTADATVHITGDERVLWNAALQASDVATGTANGTIAVKGADVAVKGLGSAAFTEADAYDVKGAAAAVQGKLDEEILRAKAAEEANAAAIAAFVEVSEEEILALFA